MAEVKLLSELIHFTPKQMAATEAADKHRYTLFGGSAGPGKSYWLRWYPIRQLIKWGLKYNLRGIHAALFSKDFPTLKDRQISKMEVEFPKWLGEIKDTKTDGLGFHLRPQYGSHVLALRNLDDPSKYLSSEFALIANEEVTENPEETFHRLRSRLRWTGIEDTKWIGATNPGGIGHAFAKRYWIDKNFPDWEKESKEFAYVPALPTDNPHLAHSYLDTLGSLPERLRKAYLEGNWDVFEGQYFTEWDVRKHVTTPFQIPPTWKRFRAYDHGRTAPACCLWFALDHDGRVWVYREFYQAGLDVDQIAQEITRLSEGEHYDFSVADPAIFHKTGMVDRYGGQTIAEAFAHQGIVWLPASNRRVDGWMLMHQYLKWDEGTAPKLVYFDTCKESIRTIPTLLHVDPSKKASSGNNSLNLRIEDLDTLGEDHAADATRYFLGSIHERKAAPPITDAEMKLIKLNEPSFDFNNFYYGRPRVR